MVEEVFEGRMQSKEQMRRGIMWIDFAKVLCKGRHEHRDSAVARRELDARSGKFGE